MWVGDGAGKLAACSVKDTTVLAVMGSWQVRWNICTADRARRIPVHRWSSSGPLVLVDNVHRGQPADGAHEHLPVRPGAQVTALHQRGR